MGLTKNDLIALDTKLYIGQKVIEIFDGVWIPVATVLSEYEERMATTAHPQHILEGKTAITKNGVIRGTMPEITPSMENNIVTVPEGYNRKTRYFELTGESTENALNFYKITKFQPYVPAYPAQKGYDISFGMHMYGDESYTMDTSAYTGRFTVTEATKTNTSFGRVYRNLGGYYLYAWDTNAYEQAKDTSDASSVFWCIGSTPGEHYYNSVVYCTNSDVTSTSSWQSEMNAVKDFSITEIQTSEATEEIQQEIIGTKCIEYDPETKEWGMSNLTAEFTSCDNTPQEGHVYAAIGSHLIGCSISYGSSGIPLDGLVFYAPLYPDAVDTVSGIKPSGTERCTKLRGKGCNLFIGDSYFQWGNVPNTPTGQSNMSIVVMFYYNESREWQYLFGYSGGDNSTHFGLNINYKNLYGRIGSDWGIKEISEKTWHTAVLTRDTAGTVTAYVDGAFANTTTTSNNVSNKVMTIGSNNAQNNDQKFYGYIADCCVYNRVLSADEIHAIHQYLMQGVMQ